MNRALIGTSSGIIIFSFAIATAITVLEINTYPQPILARGEKPAVCDSEDRSVNSTESKICGVSTTNEIITSATIRK